MSHDAISLGIWDIFGRVSDRMELKERLAALEKTATLTARGDTMARGIERRLRKLEVAAGTGKSGLIFAMIEPGETREQFEKRVDALVRQSKERGKRDLVVFKMIISHRKPTVEPGGEAEH